MQRMPNEQAGYRQLRLPRADLGLAALLLAGAEAEIWTQQTPWSSEPGGRAVTAPLALLLTLPIAARRRFPLAALAIVLGGSSLQGLLAKPPESVAVLIAWVVALYSVALYSAPRRALIGLTAAILAGALLVALGPGGSFSDYLAAMFVPVVPPWLVGTLRARQLRARELEELARRLDQDRDERAHAAVAEERARIARELHDIVAHSVSMMVVQAQAGDSLLEPEPARARESLHSIESSGRQALVELRRLLGLLRDPNGTVSRDPQPGLGDLDQLVDRVRRAGLAVEVKVSGSVVRLPPGVELTAYRIIQEALTNSLKHARASSAHVVVDYDKHMLHLEIADDGVGSPSPEGGGHGLAGMRDRVELYGGELSAEPRSSGGFVVRADIPLASST